MKRLFVFAGFLSGVYFLFGTEIGRTILLGFIEGAAKAVAF